MPNWKVIDRGKVTGHAVVISYTCPACERDADLTVNGLAIAQTAGGIVFDTGPRAIPAIIQCPYCRRRYEAA